MAEYTATAYSAKAHKFGMTEPHPTREAAIADAFARWPQAHRVSSGAGYHGSFDVRSMDHSDWLERQHQRHDPLLVWADDGGPHPE